MTSLKTFAMLSHRTLQGEKLMYFELSVTCECGFLTNIPEIGQPPQFCAICGASFERQGFNIPAMIRAEQEKVQKKLDLRTKAFVAEKKRGGYRFRMFFGGYALILTAWLTLLYSLPSVATYPEAPLAFFYSFLVFGVLTISWIFASAKIAQRKYPDPTS